MHFSPSRFVSFIFLILFIQPVIASDLNKAFKYLNTGDYPNALKYLTEAQKDEPFNVAANFGLAKYYSLKDNPAYNIDSANLYIERAAAKLPLSPDDKQTKKYLTLGVRDYTVRTLEQEINHAGYARAQQQNSVEGYQFFLDYFSDKTLLSQATAMRNQLAFNRARDKNDPTALSDFITSYPGATQIKDAKELYEKLLYEQTTADKTYTSYKTYIDKYPSGAYISDAKKNYDIKLVEYYNNRHDLEGYTEFLKLYGNHPARRAMEDSIYKIATAAGTVNAFRNFINRYSDNRNITNAWDQLYILYNKEGKAETYHQFLNEFPNYPDKERINKDIQLAELDLKPYQQGEKWGYAFQPTKDSIAIIIPAEYEEASTFNSGLAAVRLKPCNERCIYFYIDKNDRRAIDGDYNYAGDFSNGLAIVGVGNCDEDSCKYGLIDKRGHWVVGPLYSEFNEESEGLYLVSKDEKYGYLNRDGQITINLKYTNGLSFSEGVAAVALDTNWFFIDRMGNQIFIDYFHDVSSFKDSLCAVTKDGSNWGYIDKKGNWVIQPFYESAEDFEAGVGIISKKEKDPKHRDMYISQRYKIDKTGKVLEKLTAPKAVSKKKTSKKKTKK